MSKIPIFGENATHFQELIYQTSKARTYYFTKVAKIKSSKSKSKLHAYKAWFSQAFKIKNIWKSFHVLM